MRQGKLWAKGCALLVCTALGACTLFTPHPMRATATLRPTSGNTTHGMVALAERREGIQVNYDIVGLTPNTSHTFIIHVGGDCGGPEASDAGPRFRPIDMAARRDSDQLTRIWADANGAAVGFFVLPGLSLDGVRSVVGRTMIIHSGADEWDDDSSDSSDTSSSGKTAAPAVAGGVAASSLITPAFGDASAVRAPVGASASAVSGAALDQAADDEAGKPLACGVIAR